MDYKPTNFIHNGFSFSENEHWFYIHGAHLQQQAGWKLYISFTPEFAEVSLFKVAPFLESKNINFKYISSGANLEKLNSGEFGYSQIGKCIVIYLPEVKKDFISELIEKLKDTITSHPRPPYLAKLCDNPPIYYRYGDYMSSKVAPSSHLNERTSLERRKLFTPEESIQNEAAAPSKLSKLLLQYPIIDVISQQGKGGVFVALDLCEEEYKEVIIKLGYKHGNERAPGIDGIALIKNEESALKFLESQSQKIRTPKVLAAAHGDESYAIVQEKIDGENARKLLQEERITTFAIEKIIKGIRLLHKSGIVWCDAKIDNIIIFGNEEEISFIDFETSVISGSQKTQCMRTFQPKEDSLSPFSAEELDIVHFLCSILFDASSDDQRNIDISCLVHRPYKYPAKLHCAQLLQEYLK